MIRVAALLALASVCEAAPTAAENALRDRIDAIAAQAGLPPSAASLDFPQELPVSVAAAAPAAFAAVEPLFLLNGDFEGVAPFDTGLLTKRCTNLAPWGGSGWGLNAATFRYVEPTRSLEGARLRVFDENGSRVAGIFAKESRAIKMGFARFIQGDAWGGGTSCQAGPASDGNLIGWAKPKALPIKGRRLALKIDARSEEVWKFSHRALRGFVGGTSHIMTAFNVWLSSPLLPKRVVLDLAIVHDCNWGVLPCGPRMRVTDHAYHYIVHVGKNHDSPKGQWKRWIVDLSTHIDRAAEKFKFDKAVRESFSITQVEFLIEVVDGQGAVVFDNIHLVEVPEGLAIRDVMLPLPDAGLDPLPIAARPRAGQ